MIYILLAKLGTAASAQIVPDNTLPNNSVTSSEENVTEIMGGTTAGGNLFHSFEQFSLPEGNTAWFNNALTVDNIIGRVTGDSVSTIDGLIRANGSANLFLINPNGIIFGVNAALDIGGSFIGSTADSLKFAEDSEFSAVDPQSSPLLSVNIPLGLQYGNDNGDLAVTGSGNQLRFNPNFTVNRDFRPSGLKVNEGQTLGLVGGNIILDGGNLTAEAGRIELGSVADNQLVQFNFTESGLNFDYSAVNNFKNINLANASSLEVSGIGAGEVQVQGKEIIITDGSTILADTFGDRHGGNLAVNASELLVVAGTAVDLPFISRLSTDVAPGVTGNSGDIELNSTNLIIADGAQVISSSYGDGNTGNIKVNANYLELFSGSPILNSSGFFTLVFGRGSGGDINIDANRVSVSGGAQAANLTFGDGNGGDLSVKANRIELVGKSPGSTASSFLANVESGATGNGGKLSIESEYLSIKDGARAAILTLGTGNAGTLDVKAQEIQLTGGAAQVGSSGLFSNVELGATGNGGELNIETELLSIEDGAQIAITTFGDGDSSALGVKAQEIKLAGTSPGGNSSGIFSNVESTAIGNGGQIQVDVDRLNITDGAQIAALTLGLGKGGTIAIDADQVEIFGGSRNAPSGFQSTVAPAASGDGGNVFVDTKSLQLTNGGQIAVSTAGNGTGGELLISADRIDLIGRSEFGSSGIFGNAIIGNGNGGNLKINTDSLHILDGATISASNFSSNNSKVSPGEGKAGNANINSRILELDTKFVDLPSSITASTNNQGGGNINLNILEEIVINNNSEIDADTKGNAPGGNLSLRTNNLNLNNGGRISVDSSSSGDAGKIEIEANNLNGKDGQISATSLNSGGGDLKLIADTLILDDSELSTSVFDGTGGGGNLNIESNVVISKNITTIFARADRGAGGNINITTEVFLLSLDSLVDASSESGVDGAVDINSLESDRQIDYLQLPDTVSDPSALIAAVCPKNGVNSLSTIGKGGLSENPSQNLRGRSVWEDLRNFVEPNSNLSASSNLNRDGEIIEAKAWNVNDRGKVELLSHIPQKTKQDYWALFNQCRK
ncbi:filamentous hemagglutinin N-terminal domain-containing protein [Waterburya agarophytonicola K14]|uniref:Filamentous hemagglutinin N-terminal domain-containing protein n=1 Tax=Waterburya agarophytonicola KI4 TaxID=2874699 RepID=A0A964BRR0_9CYAN|nr:filamentous hemagglutinin N-terminal domain-containing protein [Waterburya agarophytonicola]MCC0177606.1 filamentous hemagglutinin N-terminal domain-containing protein [Waterburya agarophytonicola KI4]